MLAAERFPLRLGMPKLRFSDSIVAEMTVSVTFGASVFGPQIGNFCSRSEYATFSIFSAAVVREMTVSVTFGAPRSGLPVTLCRRPIVDHVAGTGHGRRFSTKARLNSRWAGVIANAKLPGANVELLQAVRVQVQAFVFL